MVFKVIHSAQKETLTPILVLDIKTIKEDIMNTGSTFFLNTVRTIAVFGLLYLALGFVSIANAAQGCGFGYHQSIYGGCILNHPGAFSRPAPMHPGCWRNANGFLRCYR